MVKEKKKKKRVIKEKKKRVVREKKTKKKKYIVVIINGDNANMRSLGMKQKYIIHKGNHREGKINLKGAKTNYLSKQYNKYKKTAN